MHEIKPGLKSIFLKLTSPKSLSTVLGQDIKFISGTDAR